MAGHEDALVREVEEKVAMMRRLGIAEIEFSTGYARRLALGPAPEPTPAQAEAPAPAVAAERPTDRPDPPDPDEAKLSPEDKRKAKQEKRLFGAGKP